jgi:mono/diheme cytochrome c family protein
MRHAIALAFAGALSLAGLSGCANRQSGSDSTVARPGIDDTQYAGRAYAGNVENGKFVFNTNCATCHGSDGRSGGVGPSLIDEDQRQDLGRTIVWIENPDPPMPKLYPSPLTERDVEDVAAFVQEIR